MTNIEHSGTGNAGGWQELLPRVEEEIARLPADQREAIVLQYYHGMSRSTIAEKIGCPEGTVASRLRLGLEKVRARVARFGDNLSPDELADRLGNTSLLLPAPATLLAKLSALATGQAMGGMAAELADRMLKTMSWAKVKAATAVAAGVMVLAGGAVTISLAAAKDGTAGTASTAQAIGAGPAEKAPVEAKPFPVNEFKGMQEREEVFEFVEKPKVAKSGAGWAVSFASKGKCDATVDVLDKDGRIIRHLASGVLGANAPHPFLQDSLSQKIEWDGLTDDFRSIEPTNFSIRVSLGLQAKYDKSMGYDPACVPDPKKVLVGSGQDGSVYLCANADRWDAGCVAFDKDGKYVKTVIPPPAADVEKFAAAAGMKLGTTKWGEKVLVCDWFGPFSGVKVESVIPKLVEGIELKAGSAPANLQSSKASGVGTWAGKITHLGADRARDEIYVGTGGQVRFIGKTGEQDKSWFPDPKSGLTGNSQTCEVSVGADGLVYLRFGGANYGRHMIRVDHDGKLVPFKKEYTVSVVGGNAWWERLPAAFKGGVDAVYCGVIGHSMTHQSGMYAGPNGMIVMGIHEVSSKWAVEHGIVKAQEAKGAEIKGNYNPVFDVEGKLLSASSVGETCMGQGVTMDRDGNIYTVFGHCLPEGQKTLYGSDIPAKARLQADYGSLVKFRGQGGAFPLNTGESKVRLARTIENGGGKPFGVPGALWAFGGISGQSGGDCQCHHIRHDMDFHARSFIPTMSLYSVIVLDSNGNRIARFGRYGNVDDSEADIKDKKGDGIRIAWVRSVAASDAALYVVDPGNRRILRAALSYAAEEAVSIP